MQKRPRRTRRAHRRQKEPPQEQQRRHLRLCFFIVLTIWTFGGIAVLFVLFYFRGFSYPSLLPIAPPVILWYRFATYLLRR